MLFAALEAPEIASLIAAIVSISLAVFAIWQAKTFYEWSDVARKEASDSASGIQSSVERIEKIFDTFYKDNFGLMRQTLEKQWSDSPETEGEAERVADEKVAALKEELRTEIDELTQRGASTHEALTGVRRDLGSLLDRAVDQSRQLDMDAQRETLRPIVASRINEMREQGTNVILWPEFAKPFPRGGGLLKSAYAEFRQLRDDGEVKFSLEPEPPPEKDLPGKVTIHFDFDT